MFSAFRTQSMPQHVLLLDVCRRHPPHTSDHQRLSEQLDHMDSLLCSARLCLQSSRTRTCFFPPHLRPISRQSHRVLRKASFSAWLAATESSSWMTGFTSSMNTSQMSYCHQLYRAWPGSRCQSRYYAFCWVFLRQFHRHESVSN